MPKPIGNLVANLTPQDKVSAKTRARFGPKSLSPSYEAALQGAPKPTNSAKPPVKYKKRKR